MEGCVRLNEKMPPKHPKKVVVGICGNLDSNFGGISMSYARIKIASNTISAIDTYISSIDASMHRTSCVLQFPIDSGSKAKREPCEMAFCEDPLELTGFINCDHAGTKIFL